MNYRHAFHAGNFADVLKHTVLLGLLDALKAKSTPFCYIDTHAGAGCYDLRDEAANKTGEHLAGVQRLQAVKNPPALLQRYLDELLALNRDQVNHDEMQAAETISIYPGSPLLASRCMREGDRAQLCELQTDEAHKLRQLMRNDARVAVHQRDGYEALKAFVPPKERRGLVLIDPPFEAQDDEFRIIESALTNAHARWSTGIYAVWYPIKLRQQIMPFHRWFKTRGIRKVLVTELLLQADTSPVRLNGCGMLLINPPWQFDQQLEQLLPVLQRELAVAAGSSWSVEWLVGE